MVIRRDWLGYVGTVTRQRRNPVDFGLVRPQDIQALQRTLSRLFDPRMSVVDTLLHCLTAGFWPIEDGIAEPVIARS